MGLIELNEAFAAQALACVAAWGVDPVPGYEPLDEGHESRRAARFPLQLLSCKTRDRIHSQFGNLDWVRDVERPHRLAFTWAVRDDSDDAPSEVHIEISPSASGCVLVLVHRMDPKWSDYADRSRDACHAG